MRTICIFNNKGGVAKTTTALNLGAGLSRIGKKVLLADIDPQNNIDFSMKAKADSTMADVIDGRITLSQAIFPLGANFDFIAAGSDLSETEKELARESEPEIVAKLFSNVSGYDYILIDCAPSMGVLNESALRFCKEVFIPTSADFVGIDALNRSIRIIQKLNSQGVETTVSKIIPTLYDKRNKICRESLAEMQNEFGGLVSYPIRVNSKLKEAPKFGKSIFSYAKSSSGAKDYGMLVEQVLSMRSLAEAESIEE